ncbi:MAG: polysaccharide deacetylase family protein [Pirellulales bacterium]
MLQRLHIALLTLLFFNGGSARGDDAAVSAAPETAPARTVVLTFDDAVKSHVTVVAPLLKELGFGATFFVTHAWMDDAQHFLSWDDVAAIHKMGFEIGNHTWTHGSFNTPLGAARLADELARVEIELARVGVPKPISFAWTGNAFGPESVAVLEAARLSAGPAAACSPKCPYGRIHPGPLFGPARHHALLIPTAGDGYPDWNLALPRRSSIARSAARSSSCSSHGVPDVAPLGPHAGRPVPPVRTLTSRTTIFTSSPSATSVRQRTGG